jgi:hypothetical protein
MGEVLAMRSPLNSPLEVGVRVVMVLAEAFPVALDLNRLVLLDHGLLHSADLGGPASLHPEIPIRAGEFGVKRQTIARGLDIMMRAGLAQMVATDRGIEFEAADQAEGFVNILASGYARELHRRASWVVATFSDMDEGSLRQQMRRIFDAWSEEFDESDWTGL